MKCDLHCHTKYSCDSTASVKEVVDAGLKKGLDCLAITDHGQIKGALEAIEYARGKPILIISGIEIKSKEGDILALNIKEVIPDKLSVRETLKRIKEKGGIAIIPHPFDWFFYFGPFRNRRFLTEFNDDLRNLLSEIDGIEAGNALIFGPGNKKAFDLAQKYNLPFTAGSDAHTPGLVGKVFLEIPGENLSFQEVWEKIKKGGVTLSGREANFLEKVISRFRGGITKLIKKCFELGRLLF